MEVECGLSVVVSVVVVVGVATSFSKPAQTTEDLAEKKLHRS